MNEEWKPVVGYEGMYEVSNLGRVKCLAFQAYRIRKGVWQSWNRPERIADPDPGADGYRLFELHNRNTRKIQTVRICNIVVKAFKNLEPDEFVHKDGNIGNDHLDNLVAKTSLLVEDNHWRWVVGYEGIYKISSEGEVRNIADKRMSETISIDGYHDVSLSKGGKSRSFKVHRLVVQAFLPDQWNPELEVNHKDGNKDNNCADNLEMVTHAENMDHYWRSDTFAEHQKEYSAYAKKAMTDRWKDPKFRKKVQDIFDCPEYKKAHSEAGKQVWSRPGMTEKVSERSKKMWAREDFHDKQVAAIKKGWSDPEKRKAVSNRMKGLVWMTDLEGSPYRCKSDEVESKLAEGYKMGRPKSCAVGGKLKIYCAKNGRVYNSMTECEEDLGLKPGDVYHIVRNRPLKRLIPIQEEYQLSLYTET